MSRVVCPCCDGSGKIEAIEPIRELGGRMLPPQEGVIAAYLKANAGRVVRYQEIINALLNGRADGGPDAPERLLHVLVCRLRPGLAAIGVHLEAVRAVGYRVTGP
jgi:DNA-binding response OmpR family regulator